MRERYEQYSERIKSGDTPLLVILVGESGVGKSTFCEAMNCKDNWYGSSEVMEKSLKAEGQPINHDTIHAFAQKAYSANPLWQVPLILEAITDKDFLLLDGPRRIQEVKALKEQYPRTLVVRLTVSEKERFRRLQLRDSIDEDAFKRILDDESRQTELLGIMEMADLVLDNSHELDQIQKEAIEFKKFLRINGRKHKGGE